MCWPEHMWRIGLGLLAVAGQPGRRQRVERGTVRCRSRGCAWLTPGPPIEPLERPDVEVLTGMGAGHDRELGRLEVELLDPAGLDQRHQRERLDAERSVTSRSGSPSWRMTPSVDVDLDDVAPMDALLDAVAHLPDEDRRDDPAARGRAGVPTLDQGADRRERRERARSMDLRCRFDDAGTRRGGRGYPADCYDDATPPAPWCLDAPR